MSVDLVMRLRSSHGLNQQPSTKKRKLGASPRSLDCPLFGFCFLRKEAWNRNMIFTHREFQQNSSLCRATERYTTDCSVANLARKFLLQSSWFGFRVQLAWSMKTRCLLWQYSSSQFTKTNAVSYVRDHRPLLCEYRRLHASDYLQVSWHTPECIGDSKHLVNALLSGFYIQF